jgi:hypothetical protein
MEESVQSYVHNLSFYLDEVGMWVGFSKWEDHKSKKTVVPTAMCGPTIHHGVNRNPKHITLHYSHNMHRSEWRTRDPIHYYVTSQESDNLRETLRKNGIEIEF